MQLSQILYLFLICYIVNEKYTLKSNNSSKLWAKADSNEKKLPFCSQFTWKNLFELAPFLLAI